MPDSLPEIWILGCSFTHGYGVNDMETYPAQLQELMPGYRVRNFGMDGYGTFQNWMTLRHELAKGQKPALVVLAYGAFHDQRNVTGAKRSTVSKSQKVCATPTSASTKTIRSMYTTHNSNTIRYRYNAISHSPP